ncbi:MAG: ABC transporter permease [Propionibacterium sp.]|jgi:putative spermidine/putrescine transport system permease protein|nr:ABC transporter permease [Propionibacterium sp.]
MTVSAHTRRRLTSLVPLLPGGLFLLGLFIVPLISTFVLSLRPTDPFYDPLPGFSTQQYVTVFTSNYYLQALIYTARMALIVTAICAVLAFPVAWLLIHARSRAVRTLIMLIVVSPLLTSVVVRSFGWRILLSAEGPINSILQTIGLTGAPLNLLSGKLTVIVVVTHVLLPFAVVTLSTSLSKIDPALLRASSSLGASPARTFATVVLPLAIPGLISGAVLVFSLSMGIYVTPLLVGGANQPLAGLRVYDQALRVFNKPGAAALSFTLFAISLTAIALLNAISRRWERRIHGQG